MKLKTAMPDWSAMFFEPARYKVAYGGRASGKSWAAAMALVLLAAQEKHFILCAREIQLSIKYSSKRVVSKMIDHMGLRELFDETEAYIDCTLTGSRFVFFGLKDGAENLRSAEGLTRVWVEEANTVSQESIDTLHPTVREPGSEIWYTFNPKTKEDAVYSMFVANPPPPRSVVRKVNYDMNPYLPRESIEEMEWHKSIDPDKYRHVWQGEPVQHSEAQVFHGRWRIEPTPAPPDGTIFYHGADWGFANDPTALVRCWIDGQRLNIDRATFGYGVDTVNLPALFNRVDTAAKWSIIADSARPETISHLRQNGYPKIRPSRKGKGSIEDGISFLRGFDIVIDPSLNESIDEFYLYRYKMDAKTGLPSSVIVDANNHGIDALRYAVENIMKPPPPQLRASR